MAQGEKCPVMMWVLNVILQEESKETLGFAAEDSKGDSVPFGTRLCRQSLVCLYLYPKAGRYLAAKPLDVRWPSNVRPCKHGARSPAYRSKQQRVPR